MLDNLMEYLQETMKKRSESYLMMDEHFLLKNEMAACHET